jgi:small-conductance mechanosensitive channel
MSFLQTLTEWWHALMLTSGPLRWIVGGSIGFVMGGLGELMLRRIFATLKKLAEKTETQYDDHLVARLRIPTRILLAIFCLHLAAVIGGIEGVTSFLSLVEWLLLSFILVESAETLLVDLVLQEQLHIQIPPLLRQVAIGVVYLTVGLVIVGHVSGMDITPLLATGSVVSLVLGLALQQPLSNLFAGLILHFDRPFLPDDWILVGNREGRIIDMGWRSTRLRTLSGDIVVLPNNTLLSAEIQNFSQPTHATARLVELIVAPSVPPHELTRWVQEEVLKIQGMIPEPPPRVWLTRLEPTFHRYTIKLWVENFAIHDELESDFLKAMWYRLQLEGFPLALPTPVTLQAETRS